MLQPLPLRAYPINNVFLEPTTGIEPVNLILTKDVLYLLSYVGRLSNPLLAISHQYIELPLKAER